MTTRSPMLAALLLLAAGGAASAQGSPPQATPVASTNVPAAPAAPESLVLYFDTASSAIRPQDEALLDQAARLYRDGHPVLMTLTGGADAVGPAAGNLQISSRRALAVLYQLVARGIPAERFELVSKGSTDTPVAGQPGVPEPMNRRVEIRWR